MRLLVVSSKECWANPAGEGFVTVGGFPYQMEALAALFTESVLMILERKPPAPVGATLLQGPGLRVDPLPEPSATGWRRKLALLLWLPRHWRRLWRAVSRADAVHAPVPGDLGTIGLLLALARHKPLLVRHCGTWGCRATAADRLLDWLLPRVAGGRNVVLATGGGAAPPCPANPAVTWIFSTTLTRGEIERLSPAAPWRPGEPLRLIQVGRMVAGKNAAATLRALEIIRRHHPDARLELVGDGPDRRRLESLAVELDLDSAVTFHGNVEHRRVLELLGRSHLFVFPTRVAEGFPKAVHEAMACGLPIVVPRVSVLPRLVEEGAGILLDAPEPGDVAQAVLDLAGDPQRLDSLSRRASEIARRYTLDDWTDAIRSRLEAAWGPLGQP